MLVMTSAPAPVPSSAAADEPRVALGIMTFGTTHDDAASFAVLDAYVAAGGVWIDTADCYAFWLDPAQRGGASERLLGRWLAANPGVREQVRIGTKVGAEPVTPGGPPQGLAPATIRAGIAGSLERLGLDRVDLFWGHLEDRSVPVEESALALGELVTQGLTTAVGLSNHPAWRTERALGAARAAGVTPVSAVQLRETYLRTRPEARVAHESHLFGPISTEQRDHAQANDLEIWAYSPMLAGYYDRDDRPYPEPFEHPGTHRRLEALTRVAAELGVTRGQVVMAWLAGGTPGARPIIGGSSVAQLEQAMAGVVLELPGELRDLLDAAV